MERAQIVIVFWSKEERELLKDLEWEEKIKMYLEGIGSEDWILAAQNRDSGGWRWSSDPMKYGEFLEYLSNY
jgi:hypothetical protein